MDLCFPFFLFRSYFISNSPFRCISRLSKDLIISLCLSLFPKYYLFHHRLLRFRNTHQMLTRLSEPRLISPLRVLFHPLPVQYIPRQDYFQRRVCFKYSSHDIYLTVLAKGSLNESKRVRNPLTRYRTQKEEKRRLYGGFIHDGGIKTYSVGLKSA